MKRRDALTNIYGSAKEQRQLRWPLLPTFWRGELETLVKLLNEWGDLGVRTVHETGKPAKSVDFCRVRAELRRLISEWLESGPNLIQLFGANPALQERAKYGRTELLPTRTGRGFLTWRSEAADSLANPTMDFALAHFVSLILNPEWERLGGPCARCDRYFAKRVRSQKVYCSRRCETAVSAFEAMRQRRQKEHAEKLRRAEVARDKWEQKPRKEDWKKLVARETGLTGKWLSRAVNKGELRAGIPKKELVGRET